jgi:Phosphoglucose isomerase
MLIVDLSRQRMTLETLNHLLRLATARHIQKYITQLAWGQNDPDDPIVPLRVLQQQQAQARQQGNHHNHPTHYQTYHQQYTHQGPVPTVLSDERHRKTTRFEEADEAGGARQQQQQQYRTPVPSFTGEGHSSHRHNNHQNNANDTTAIATPHIPVIPSLHLSLRAPTGQGLEILTANGVNALTAIHSDWERMQRISESLRRGQWQGITGHAIKDVVVVGRGVAIMALRFVYLALLKDETSVLAQRAGFGSTSGGRRVGGAGTTGASSTTPSSASSTAISTPTQQQLQQPQTTAPLSYSGQRRIKFLTSVDPVRAAAVVADLDPASTLIISFALQGNEETTLATQTLKTWLLHGLGGTGSAIATSSAIAKRQEIVLSKHMMLVTGNDHLAAATHVPASSVFVLPEHSRCEAFTSFTAATLLVSFCYSPSNSRRVCFRLPVVLLCGCFLLCNNVRVAILHSVDRSTLDFFLAQSFFFGPTELHTTALVHCVWMVHCRTIFGGRP